MDSYTKRCAVLYKEPRTKGEILKWHCAHYGLPFKTLEPVVTEPADLMGFPFNKPENKAGVKGLLPCVTSTFLHLMDKT